MEIRFRSGKTQKCCSSEKECNRKWGSANGKIIRRRLADLEAAETLADVFALPQARCHELTENRRGQFAVDVKHPFRLIFQPANNPIPRKEDGGIDCTRVTHIEIIEVVDYHGD